MNRPTLPEQVGVTRIIPVLRGHGPARATEIVSVLRSNGLDIAEITMDSPQAVRTISSLAGGDFLVGAGTVRSIDDVAAAIDAGADFLVAPHTDLAVVKAAVDMGVPIIPGVMTPTEAVTAWNAGAAAVKIFPASVVGPGLLKALRGPLPDVPMVPTGGITLTDARSFLAAGAVAIGVGGWLTAQNDLGMVAARADALVEAVGTAGSWVV